MVKSRGFPQITMLTARPPFRMSRAVFGLLVVTLFIAVLLVFSTVQKVGQARTLMDRILTLKGEIVVGSVEAALRTSFMHSMTDTDTLSTLLDESGREDGVAFILVSDSQGQPVFKSGQVPSDYLQLIAQQSGSQDSGPATHHWNDDIFILAKTMSLEAMGPMMMRMMHSNQQRERALRSATVRTVSVGLWKEPYEAARRQDVRHAVFMGAILFLIGISGVYFLFLYQAMQVTRSTLSNMRLYMENVIASIPTGLLTLDREKRLVASNQQAEKILGHGYDEMVGKPLAAFLPGIDFQSLFAENKGIDYVVELKSGDHASRSVQVQGSPLKNSSGDSIGAVLILKDLTTIREMERKVQRSHRMAALGKMAAGVAHEIRNPLGTLRGFAHYFGRQQGDNEEGSRYAELMKSEIDRLNTIISGMLQFARPREPQLARFQLRDLFAKTADLMGQDFARYDIAFHRQGHENIVLEADADLLLQVLLNLLQNSVVATGAGGSVTLSAEEKDGEVILQISDTGAGMDQEVREKMFDPFFTTRPSGTGLGLAVSHQIIEQHGGTIRVDSTPGKGTTITIVLPRLQGK